MPMRVTIVTEMDSGGMSGVTRYIHEMISHARPESLGIDLRVLHSGRETPAGEWLARSSRSTRRSALARKVDQMIRLPVALRRSRSSVVHYPSGKLPAGWAAGPSPRVVTLHGAARLSRSPWLSKEHRASGDLLERRLRQGSRKLARVITVSQWSKRELVQASHLRPEQVDVIPNGVDLEKFRPPDDQTGTAAWRKATLGFEAPYLLHVGPCRVRKNVLRLVQAFGRLKRRRTLLHKLVLTGAPGPLSPAVRSAITGLRLKEDVVLTGELSDEALVRLYGGASVFVFPSLYEGFGLPVLEAMACGTPVVTSNCSALPETAGGAAALVGDPTSIENLSTVLQQVLEDGARRRALRRRGLARAREFTWEACAAAHLKLYRKVAKVS